ncbi:MAG: endonuclease/exonuclease/phosphatase family protein [Hyphomonas sp.]|uniref:endonuclease/exonuclease/phosphatase family protein n=1 Tax=Hyphomonas sp. TaxID=87 RepID=UPI0030015253
MLAILKPAFYLVGALGLFAAFVPKFRTEIWWLRVWVYARQQTAILLAAFAGLFLFLYGVDSWLSAGLMLAYAIALFTCAADLWPYTRGRPLEMDTALPGEEGTGLSVLLLNVLQENTDEDAVRERIRNAAADVVFLSETNARWRSALSRFEGQYPHTSLLPKEEHNGLLVYSRFPIVRVQERYLCQSYVPSLTIDIDVDGREVRLYCIHPRPPRPRDATEHLDDELMIVAEELRAQERPALVMGDFNEVGWSWMVRQFKDHASLCDPKRGRGLYNSFGATNPLLAWPLDHVFATDDFAIKSIRRLRACGSDHYPMIYSLLLRP